MIKKLTFENKFLPFFLGGWGFLFLLTSCDQNRVYEKNEEIDNARWDISQKVRFEVPVQDTLSKHNFYINFRNSGNYPYSNVYIFINTIFPDKKLARDTVEFFVASPSGEWLGKGSGNVWESQVLFKRGVIFPDTGLFVFEFEQAMRDTILEGVMDVGLRIEKQ